MPQQMQRKYQIDNQISTENYQTNQDNQNQNLKWEEYQYMINLADSEASQTIDEYIEKASAILEPSEETADVNF